MNRHPILVRNIRHLTDARYFAAMGVDWMSISLTHDPASFFLWHSLKDWISGVQLVAEVDVRDEDLLAKTIIDVAPDGILCPEKIPPHVPDSVTLFFEHPSYHKPALADHAKYIVAYDPARHPPDHFLSWPASSLFLQADWNPAMLKTLVQTGYLGGICLYGGKEEITGVRDYETMDELLEILLS